MAHADGKAKAHGQNGGLSRLVHELSEHILEDSRLHWNKLLHTSFFVLCSQLGQRRENLSGVPLASAIHDANPAEKIPERVNGVLANHFKAFRRSFSRPPNAGDADHDDAAISRRHFFNLFPGRDLREGRYLGAERSE
jgi:hypothetical protein